MKFLLLQTPTRNVAASGSTSRERRVERQLHRRNTGFQGQHHRRVIFASLPSSMRRFTPTPSKKLRRHLMKKEIVTLVDGYRTSRVCSHCKNDLEDIAVPERGFDCDHRKKMIRLRLEKNRVKRCIDNDNRIVIRFSLCLNKTQTGYEPIVQLKLCRQCSAGNTHDGNLISHFCLVTTSKVLVILFNIVNSIQ
ncbi:hypothetical protein RMCBS344292_09499 [Rhizopus microsporus]|nr:hypothetical protein RMCBS344292_09499 [Rhizopus microsporus]